MRILNLRNTQFLSMNIVSVQRRHFNVLTKSFLLAYFIAIYRRTQPKVSFNTNIIEIVFFLAQKYFECANNK